MPTPLHALTIMCSPYLSTTSCRYPSPARPPARPQVNRRTLQYKFTRIEQLLAQNDRADLTGEERETVIEDMVGLGPGAGVGAGRGKRLWHCKGPTAGLFLQQQKLSTCWPHCRCTNVRVQSAREGCRRREVQRRRIRPGPCRCGRSPRSGRRTSCGARSPRRWTVGAAAVKQAAAPCFGLAAGGNHVKLRAVATAQPVWMSAAESNVCLGMRRSWRPGRLTGHTCVTPAPSAPASPPPPEARGGLHIVEQSLWASVPAYLRRLSAALKKHTGRELPLEATPMRFSSWMGGDRDGNPNVTAKVGRGAGQGRGRE